MSIIWQIGILIGIAALVWAAWPRMRIPRTSGLEGIDDPAAAEAYDRLSRLPQFGLLRALTLRKIGEQRPAGVLADIGCGPGRLTIRIAAKFPDLAVMGIDASDEMVRSAAANASALGLAPRLDFRQGDVARLPLPSEALDFAVTTFSLHHWSNPAQALAEIYRVLKPGGRLLVFDLRRDARRIFSLLLRFAQAVVVPAPLRRANEPLGSLLASYTEDEVEGLFARSPFVSCRIVGGAGWMWVWGEKQGLAQD